MFKNKKMANLGLIIALVGGLMVPIGVYMFNKYSGKSRAENHIEVVKKQDELGNKIDSTQKEIVDELTKENEENKSLISSKIDSTEEAIIKKQIETQRTIKDDINKATNKISSKVDKSSTSQERNQKEILGKLEEIKKPPKDPNALYIEEKKWGNVIGFQLSDDRKNFKIDEISFDAHPNLPQDLSSEFQYKSYILKFQNIGYCSGYPPLVKTIEGIVIGSVK